MGQELGRPGEDTQAQRQQKHDPVRVAREQRRARQKIQAFRNRATLRAGTDDLCATLLVSWRSEKDRIIKTWKALSAPAKRTLVMTCREKVVRRAKILHSVIALKALSVSAKDKAVRRLMEKCAFELFDINVVYDDTGLILLVEDIFVEHGGGAEPPFGLLHDLDQTFDGSGTRLSYMSHPSLGAKQCDNSNSSEEDSIGSGNGGGAQQAELPSSRNQANEAKNKNSLNGQLANSAVLSPVSSVTTVSTSNLQRSSRSLNSLQGYYNTADHSKTVRICKGSSTIQRLLYFVPDSALDQGERKQLTLELLMEMRHAFLTHFAVLVYSELFDDKGNVMHKYEYDSTSDTEDAFTETEVEEDEDEYEQESDGDVENS